jgi:hypothetical protein
MGDGAGFSGCEMVPIRWVSATESRHTIGSLPPMVRVMGGLPNFIPTVKQNATSAFTCLHSAFGHPTGCPHSQDRSPAWSGATANE